MPLTIAGNLSSYTLAAGEPFVVEIQLLDSAGRGTDITDTALYLTFYDGGRREIVNDFTGSPAQYEGLRLSDDTGEFFRFAFDGRFSEGMYGKGGVRVEISRRFENGRLIIATGALAVLPSALTIPSLPGEGIADSAVRVSVKASAVFGQPPLITIQVVPFNGDASVILVPAPGTLFLASDSGAYLTGADGAFLTGAA